MNTSSYFNDLDTKMQTEFISVSNIHNPFMKNISHLTDKQIMHLAGQYCFFSKNIISFFIDAIYILGYYNYTSINKELLINIREELGEVIEEHSKNNVRLAHYTYLRKAIQRTLHIDAMKLKGSPSTELFILRLRNLVNEDNPNRVSGVVYALEATASSELAIVKKIMEVLSILPNSKLPDDLNFFFDLHSSEIEIGHKNFLKETCSEYLKNEAAFTDFSKGFDNVMKTMDDWWNGLYSESKELE